MLNGYRKSKKKHVNFFDHFLNDRFFKNSGTIVSFIPIEIGCRSVDHNTVCFGFPV
jgi:hypothetical protein